MAKYVEKITKKEREGKSPQNDQKIKEIWPLLKNYSSKWDEISFGIHNCGAREMQMVRLSCDALYICRKKGIEV